MSSGFKPPDKEALRRKYDSVCPLYQQLIEEIRYILEKGLSEREIKISDIEHRPKAFESFYGKVVREEIIGDPFESLEDIAGIRIICLYRSDLDRVETLIKEKLKVIKAKVLRDKANVEFGYMSDHFVVKLPAHFQGERYDSIKDLKCEIQVRTVSMHAWATVSHHLDYKQDVDIPSHLKNDFYALSGVFYIADSLFEQFRKARDETLQKLVSSVEQKGFNLAMEMNMDTLKAYLEWKLPDRERADQPKDLSPLLSDIKKAGIENYKRLDEIIQKDMQWLLEDEKRSPPHETDEATHLRRPTLYVDVGVVRRILKHEGLIPP